MQYQCPGYWSCYLYAIRQDALRIKALQAHTAVGVTILFRTGRVRLITVGP